MLNVTIYRWEAEIGRVYQLQPIWIYANLNRCVVNGVIELQNEWFENFFMLAILPTFGNIPKLKD